jgi:hypothetical protein
MTQLTAIETALTAALLAAPCLYFLLSALGAWRALRTVPALCAIAPPGPRRWPRLSLVITARNEAATLEPAVRSRLHDDYPELEVVLVDDRSDDGTAEIVDRLAAADPRVKPVHLRELPLGWLGKLHAMQRGLELATGEWILFSDADTHLAPGTLRRVLALCEQERLDHVAVIPRFWRSTWLVEAVLSVFVRLLVLGGRLWAVPDPRSSAAVGSGLFNLVRRSALDRSPGLEHLRLEVADDVALAQMLKLSGARTRVVNAAEHVSLQHYTSLRETAHGLEKNACALMGFRLPWLLLFISALLWLELGPFLALLAGPAPSVRFLGAAALLAGAGTHLALARWARVRPGPALLFPVGAVLLAAMVVRSGLLGWWRGGVRWRDTFYPLELLRAGSRLRFR